jgi:PhzF family phenazine biosynthesis protein
MNVFKIAAFCDGKSGGNPAGVAISDELPSESEMRGVAAQVGFSETAFAARMASGWRVRYFSPETEVLFCGHATIALGAVLALEHGDGVFPLTLNHATITVEGHREGELISAALQSPPTRSRPALPGTVSEALALFGFVEEQLDPRIPPAFIYGGVEHLVIALKTRESLASMRYDLATGRDLMNREGLTTIALIYAETAGLFHARNPFVSGGVYEDPATGAAAAALGGYLRDIAWPHGGLIDVVRGEDMGMRSLLRAEISLTPGASIRVSGSARIMES